MKNNYRTEIALQACTLLLIVLAGTNTLAQVGIGTTNPAAALEITSTNDGVLIPRVSLTSTTSLSINPSVLINTPTASELVYNITTVNDVTPGYYYLSTAAGPWIRLATGANATPGWSLTGNGATTGSNFLGTLNVQDLALRTGNIERLRIGGASGNIFLNSTGAQFIRWSDAGLGVPQFNTRSDGTKLTLWPALSSNSADYALGINGGVLWYGIPKADNIHSHRFYGGDTPLMTIRGDGNVGIGTPSPATKLDISSSTAGAIKIVDGTQGNGKVLQSDANGVASWVLGTGFGNTKLNATGSWVCPWNAGIGQGFNTGIQVTIPTSGWYIFETGLLVQSDCNDYWLYINGVGEIWRTYCAVAGVQYNIPREQSRILFINAGIYSILAGKTLIASPIQCAPATGNPGRYIRFVKVQN